MESYMDVTYEVIDPLTREVFFTKDNYVATHHYEKGYIVNETHTTVTVSSSFNQTRVHVISCWNDEDTQPETEEI